MKRNGFTLMEVVISLAILSIITVMCMSIIISSNNVKQKSIDKLLVINQIENFIELYDANRLDYYSSYYFDCNMSNELSDYFYFTIDDSLISAYYVLDDSLIYEIDLGR